LTIATVSITKALTSAGESKNRTQASDFAVQGLEIARQLRDSDWSSFDNLSGQYCMAQECAMISPSSASCGRKTVSCGVNAGAFSREVTIEKNSSRCSVDVSTRRGVVQLRNTLVQVTVSWSDSSCSNGAFCRSTSVESCMANKYADPNL
jgi:hypothetical protein